MGKTAWVCALLIVCAVLVAGEGRTASAADDIRYEGVFTLAPNGDMTAAIKLTPPMTLYQNLRESISNLYLILREFASARADQEVAEKKADWDDANRSITISMKVLGAARNLGKGWEVEIPKTAEFSNLDEGKKTFYFNEATEAGAAGMIRGTSRIILPATTSNLKWNQDKHVISFELPPVVSASASDGKWMIILGAVLALAGLAMTGASFAIKGAPRSTAV
ncbi:MAG: hypothetical protein AB7W37_06395 [Syntrophobacteraceae bacterium]